VKFITVCRILVVLMSCSTQAVSVHFNLPSLVGNSNELLFLFKLITIMATKFKSDVLKLRLVPSIP